MTRLKPCPFCGAEVRFGLNSDLMETIIVHPDEPRECFGRIVTTFVCVLDRNKTVEEWNRRASE